MGMEHLQSNLSGGALAPALHARADIEKYAHSVAEAKNMVIVPQGGVRRRPGLAKTEDGYFTENVRLSPFVFNQQQKYIIIFRDGFIDVMRDGVLVKTGIVSLYTATEIKEADVIQSADTVIITHESIAPHSLVRGATDADWTLSEISLAIPEISFENIVELYENTGDTQSVNLKVDDIVWNNDGNAVNGTDNNFYKSKLDRSTIDLSTDDFTNTTNWEDLALGKEPVWSATRGYPRTCALYGGRLWLAGSTQKPTWASKVNGFYDFTWTAVGGIIPNEHAIFDTLATDEFNKITNIYSARGIQVFTTAAEFVNSVSFPTPNDSAWSQQTGYGSKRLRPIFIDGATLYVDSLERTIRQFIYNYNEDAYTSANITLLASHLMTEIVSMSSIKGTTLDVSDYVYVVNGDGTIAVLNTLRSEGLLGWTHWDTQGSFKDVVVIGKEVYFLVERENNYFIEKLDEDTYTDHSVLITGTAPTTSNIIDAETNIVDGGDN